MSTDNMSTEYIEQGLVLVTKEQFMAWVAERIELRTMDNEALPLPTDDVAETLPALEDVVASLPPWSRNRQRRYYGMVRLLDSIKSNPARWCECPEA